MNISRLKKLESKVTKEEDLKTYFVFYEPEKRAYSIEEELVKKLGLEPTDFKNSDLGGKSIPKELIKEEDLKRDNIILINFEQ